MRIRPQLIWTMAAVLAPLVLLAAAFTYVLADTQRELQMQRVVERARALRLVLDAEVAHSIRLLSIQAERAELGAAAPPAAQPLHETLQHVMRHQPHWAMLLVVEPDGRETLRVDRSAGRVESTAPRLDERTLRQVLQTAAPAGSGLVASADGRQRFSFIALPVLQDGRVQRVLAAGIRDTDWLAVLRAHAPADGGTLALLDQDRLLVARTLNPERWAGQPAAPEFLRHLSAAPEGAFINTGLEGQRLYSAYSRLDKLPWILCTGVPADEAEAPLRRQVELLAAGVLLTTLIAGAAVVVLRRRILAVLHGLGDVSGHLRASDAEAATALPLAIGEAEGVRARLRDTLRSEADARAEAEAARAQADAANRGKDDFLAMMAHELRNPISAMVTAVALLDAAHATPETDRHARGVLRRQVRQMTRLVDDLLDAARVARGAMALHRAPLELAALVRQVVDTFEAGGRTRHLRLELALQPAWVNGDTLRLEQVVGNLLDNAAKFTPEGGRLRLTLHTVDGHAELSLDDDGVGMDAGLQQRLFDPYTQAEPGIDRSRGGLGLGLHVVRRLVELHGGSVSAHSDGPGRGACFTVRLPLAAEAPVAAPQLPSGALPPLRVALVEDNADGREAVAGLLRMAGHDVLSAGDGEAGLALLLSERPDVAMVDLGLPLLDGLTLARRLRRAQESTGDVWPGVLLALTAYGDEHTRADAAQAGFDGFLQKPFDLRAFEAAVLEARGRTPAPG